MSEENLSRRLATAILDALKAQGHVLLVKGANVALVRELAARMLPQVEAIAERVAPPTLVGGEPTSTFGDDSVDDAVEALVADVAQAVVDSDQVEDVFADDHVIRRDVFRAVRQVLLSPPAPEPAPTSVTVRLDALGYLASTVARRAAESRVREALARAAETADAELGTYDPDAREAHFTASDQDLDVRLELEEAVFDELVELVNLRAVELPTLGRSIDMGRELDAAERAAAQPILDEISARVLHPDGCPSSFGWTDPRTLVVTFTPLSDKDASHATERLDEFEKSVRAATARADTAEVPPRPPAARARREAAPVTEAGPDLAFADTVASHDDEPAPRRRSVAAPASKPAAKRAAAPKGAAEKAPSRGSGASAKQPAAAGKAASRPASKSKKVAATPATKVKPASRKSAGRGAAGTKKR